MTKDEFFDQLHKNLAQKYGVSDLQINNIRSFTGMGKTREEIKQWAEIKKNQPRRKDHTSKTGRREKSREYYQQIVNLVTTATQLQWDEINQKTEYDKKGTTQYYA